MVLLQGQLQNMFDALYELGVIDPVLKRDWQKAMEDLPQFQTEVQEIFGIANAFQNDVKQLKEKLAPFNTRSLEYLAIEVAKEFADFHTRAALH